MAIPTTSFRVRKGWGRALQVVLLAVLLAIIGLNGPSGATGLGFVSKRGVDRALLGEPTCLWKDSPRVAA